MKSIRTRYPWPASAIGAADMRMLYEIRQASRPRVTIAGLVVRAIRDRYDGEKRNPYNEIECGSNYARSMASFSLIPSLMGYVANLPEGTLTFDPKLPELSGYFGTAQAWGIANIDEQSLTLNLKAGMLTLRAIGCPWLHDITHVILDGKDIPFTRTPDGVAFAQTVIRASVRID